MSHTDFQGCNAPNIPKLLAPAAAASAGFKGMVFHSVDFKSKMSELLDRVPPPQDGEPAPAPIVVIGGGKSAQE